MEKGKMYPDTEMTSGKDIEDENDRLNDLPEGVLLHIMKFMDAKHAVQTCVLSKQWKNLWKQVSFLSFSHEFFRTIADYNKFVPRVLTHRDDSALHKVDIWAFEAEAPNNLLDKVTDYAVLHKVQQLVVTVNLISDRFFPLIFSCQHLTFLKLSITSFAPTLELPKSLQLPTLKILHLDNVSFTASDNDCAEPFSTCNLLDTLVIEYCFLHSDANSLCISNSNLRSLTLGNTILKGPDQILLSTPNLEFLSVICDPIHQLSVSNLSCLEQVNIDVKSKTYFHAYYMEKSCLALISLLQVLTDYVKILILSSSTLEILNGLLASDSMITQIPCFVQLKSLKLKIKTSVISDEGVSRVVEYLIQKSPMAKVDVINC